MPLNPPEMHQHSNCEGEELNSKSQKCAAFCGKEKDFGSPVSVSCLLLGPDSCLCRVTGLGMGPQEGTLLLC